MDPILNENTFFFFFANTFCFSTDSVRIFRIVPTKLSRARWIRVNIELLAGDYMVMRAVILEN